MESDIQSDIEFIRKLDAKVSHLMIGFLQRIHYTIANKLLDEWYKIDANHMTNIFQKLDQTAHVSVLYEGRSNILFFFDDVERNSPMLLARARRQHKDSGRGAFHVELSDWKGIFDHLTYIKNEEITDIKCKTLVRSYDPTKQFVFYVTRKKNPFFGDIDIMDSCIFFLMTITTTTTTNSASTSVVSSKPKVEPVKKVSSTTANKKNVAKKSTGSKPSANLHKPQKMIDKKTIVTKPVAKKYVTDKDVKLPKGTRLLVNKM